MFCIVDDPSCRAVEQPVLEHDGPVGLSWRLCDGLVGENPEQPQDISVLRLGKMLLDAIPVASDELCQVRVRMGVELQVE